MSNDFKGVEKLKYEHLKPYLNKSLTAISKLQMQFANFIEVFKIIENIKIST